jgi:hypothetical protein
MESNRHFTAIVVGEAPDEIMKKYDLSEKVEPYVVYRLSEIPKYKENTLNAYKYLANSTVMPETIRDEYKAKVQEIEEMSDIDFYSKLTEDLEIDEDTGNAMCDINPDGHYNICRLGKNLAMPLINKEDQEVFQARKRDIQWDKIHLANQDVYRIAWEMVMGDRKPSNEEEEIIYENMKNRTEYFRYYGDIDTYVASNTAFWGYAFVTKDSWVELTDDIPQIQWVTEFYDNFIKNLPEDTLISVYECIRT